MRLFSIAIQALGCSFFFPFLWSVHQLAATGNQLWWFDIIGIPIMGAFLVWLGVWFRRAIQELR